MKEKFDGHTPAWIAEKKTWNLRTACVCREQPGQGWSFIFAAVGTLRPGEHAHGRRRAVGCRWPTAKVGTSGGISTEAAPNRSATEAPKNCANLLLPYIES